MRVMLEETATLLGHSSEVLPEQRRGDWVQGELQVPPSIKAEADRISLQALCEDPEKYTSNKKVLNAIDYLKRRTIPKLEGKILAEMHARVSYGLSCFVMVTMGAALGLLFRGGQIISAFAICVVPASVVIIMMLMGKEMVSNPDVSAGWGLASIWGGPLVLLVGNVLVFSRLYRL